MVSETHITRNDDETRALGRRLAPGLGPGDVVALTGELGSGKTCFTQGIGRGLKVSSYITSPTFTIMNQYRGTLPVYHFDLYRIASPAELEEFGFEEYLYDQGVSIIEWAEKCAQLLPPRRITVDFTIQDRMVRQIKITRQK